ncbi:DUF3833 family protein [Caulobacter sp. S45]|uniref:DUF3833 family protein n=1 Tax=Caulobacter sp. S45 TaxID=1641861 RepID=UPI00157633FB|nr:DUF3833 family protein [Caulobacter sp. S45]
MSVEGQTAASFFADRWKGRGEVRGLFGERLRTFTVFYECEGSATDSALLCDERVVYNNRATMVRSWLLSSTGGGAMLGLEASQGGRMRIRDTRQGFQIRYDRLRMSAGANVIHLRVNVWREADGRVRMKGWTRALGIFPVFRTSVVLEPVSASAAGVRPASR